ncbi:hypothetical protein [Micromonospora sp. CB01531]|uniref:hypothetical protein n=1 Tax=Micromonospora sp. CB01531 TaxID=1718947 RepID=UPI00093CC574|nr:hypothetical protein [Micromonospora sp. CB01531]OKI45115.1 hypothetical protein A6A27_11915 [Micromonospora sp. CB01531]
MAITSYPFDNQDTSEIQYSSLFRELQDSGIADTHGGTGFQVSGDPSGMGVFLQPGFALLRGHACQSTAVERLDIQPASPALRIDRVVLRLDPVANSIVPVVLQGVPNSTAPALTQTDTGVYEESLGLVAVDPNVGVIALTKVTDDRAFLGSRVGCWSTATRPKTPRKARLGLNTTTGKWEYHNGTGWADLIPSTVDNSTRWNGYTVTVSTTTPSGTPTTDRIWIQPTS